MELCLHCGYKFSGIEAKISTACPMCGKETRRHEKHRERNEDPASDIGTGRITRKNGEGTDAHVAALAREAVMLSPFSSFISPSLIKSLYGLCIISSLLIYAGIIALLYTQLGMYYAIAGAVVQMPPLLFFIFCIRILLEAVITLFSVRDVLSEMSYSKRKRSHTAS